LQRTTAACNDIAPHSDRSAVPYGRPVFTEMEVETIDFTFNIDQIATVVVKRCPYIEQL
jgi:hypothetical protein